MDYIIFSEAKFRLKMFVFISSILVFSIFAFLWGYFQWTNRRFIKLAGDIRGPPAYPLIGSTLEFVGTPIRMLDIQIYTKIIN